MSVECFWGDEDDVLLCKAQMDYFEKLIEQKEKLLKLCNELEANEKNEICKTLFGALIGTCKIKEIYGIQEVKK